MITLLVDALAPGRRWRAEPIHPYTVDGRQVDVQDDRAWVEVWECGLAHPDVLARAGLAGWHGLALGLGLDRLLMLRKDIPDIRLLRSADPRAAGQMIDLGPYRRLGHAGTVVRDLSVAVDADDDVERWATARGSSAPTPMPSRRSVLSETAYGELPASAIARMGMQRRHKNVLVQVVLRHLERTLTDTDANALRGSHLPTALHAGGARRRRILPLSRGRGNGAPDIPATLRMSSSFPRRCTPHAEANATLLGRAPPVQVGPASLATFLAPVADWDLGSSATTCAEAGGHRLTSTGFSGRSSAVGHRAVRRPVVGAGGFGFLHVPEHGVHGFRNTRRDTSILILFARAPRAFFQRARRDRRAGCPRRRLAAFYQRHDQYMVDVDVEA